MEEPIKIQQVTIEEVTNYAKKMLFSGKTTDEVRDMLITKGINEADADVVIDSLYYDLLEGRKNTAKKHMISGLFWCIGGAIIILSHVAFGYVFWVAIIFGGIRFARGVMEWNNTD